MPLSERLRLPLTHSLLAASHLHRHLHNRTRQISILRPSLHLPTRPRIGVKIKIKINSVRHASTNDGNTTTSSYNNNTGIKMTLTNQHSAIISQVDERFVQARESGDLLFFPSEVYHHEEAGIQFQIRLCPALQEKPRLPTPHFDFDDEQSPHAQGLENGVGNDNGKHTTKKPDPFAPPYISNLLVGELRDEEEGDEFAILLNKYSVVPNHFLMVTKEYKSQTGPLFPSELVQTYLLLDAARRIGKDFFAFYNCGDVSGASQPHKHIQFLPVEDDGPPIEKLARTVNLEHDSRAFTFNSLPFATHIRRLPASLPSYARQEMEDILGEAFMTLLDLAISTVRHDPTHPAGQPSYNVILTRQHMYVVPRKREEHILRETGDALSVNALGFAGMLLVKSERELEAVKRESVVEILKDVALANVHERQIIGVHEMDRDTQ